MFSVVLLLCCNIGILSARQPDVDHNRLHLSANEVAQTPDAYYIKDFGKALHKSEKYSGNLNPLYQKTYDEPSKIHKPREDPRIYYLSEAYVKDLAKHPEKISWELTHVYPGRNVIRADEKLEKNAPVRIGQTSPYSKDSNLCVRCPRDRTLVAKKGSDRVFLRRPHLSTCTGRAATRNVYFQHMYGPEFGSLVEKGTHVIVGRISYGNRTLRRCKMQVHVVTQGCHTPKYLVAHCGGLRSHCSFSCSDSRKTLRGESSLECGPDMRWKGELPVCIGTRTSCQHPPPPEHGILTCQGASGSLLAEGSRCRVRCQRGWRASHRAVSTVCRRGAWTKTIVCQPRRNV